MKKNPLYIQDLFPLMCALLGLPIPNNLWGHIPDDILAGLRSRPELDANIDWTQQIKGLPIPQAETSEILNRLAELGYI